MLKAENLHIKTITENTVAGLGLLGEWGLSVLIEAGERTYLVDTGTTRAVTNNMDTMHVDPQAVDAVVLSHGHFDHTGGLRAVLGRMNRKNVRIVAHPDIWDSKYSRNKKTGDYRYVGRPFRREELEGLGARFELTAEPTWLTEDVAVSGTEPMTSDFERVAENLCVKNGAFFEPDHLADDQSVYLRTDLGLVIVLGCAHRGMVNIIGHARELMETKEVYMVIGGTHLGPVSEKQLTLTIDALREMGVQRLGVSHCTGMKAAAKLNQEFGDQFFYNNAGTTIRFPFNR